MVVPFPPGQALDLAARAAADAAKPYFSQPIAVVNRPGGAGTIGTAEIVQARPDGYTIGFDAVAPLTVQPHLGKLPYKGPEDLTPVIKIGVNPMAFVVRSEAPWKSMKDLLEYTKQNPGKIRVASGGKGTIPHIDLELLKEQAKVDLTFVPFSGAADYLPSLLGGQIEAASDSLPSFLGQIAAGKLRLLATYEESRNPLFPDTPTFRELGFDITYSVYHSVVAPKGVPQEVVTRLHDAFKKAIESDAFRTWAKNNSYQVQYAPASALAEQLKKDYSFYGDVIKKLGLESTN